MLRYVFAIALAVGTLKQPLVSITGCHVTIHPLVVYGESCCGKSVIMAATVKAIREQWHGSDACIVYRIIG